MSKHEDNLSASSISVRSYFNSFRLYFIFCYDVLKVMLIDVINNISTYKILILSQTDRYILTKSYYDVGNT